MIYLIGEVSNGAAKLADARARGMGRMFVDRLDEAAYTPLPGEPWALDNGAYREYLAGGDYETRFARFAEMLEIAAEVARDGNPPLFVVAPDRPADTDSILETLTWIQEYREERLLELDPMGWTYGTRHGALPLYLAVQNGMTPAGLEELRDAETDEPILEHFAGLFLGGDDDFKATVGEWRELADRWGMKLHYGRATQSRIRGAVEAGCDSGDSAHPNRLGPDRWARFLRVYEAETSRAQFNLSLEYA